MAWLVVGDRVLASADVATTRSARRKGLLGRDGIEGALVLDRCRWVHTVGMRFPLDVAYLDREGVVLKTVRMGRHRVGLPHLRAARVVEAEAGAFGRWGLHVGDVVELPVTGLLVLVATPIGNLGDLAPRAVTALASADAVVCEDTRRTGRLLQHAGISGARLLVANEHTEAACATQVAQLLDGGATVAVVTDAGTPGVSDPGERLVRAALAGGHRVEAVPGPSAVLHALVVSGLPADRFVMEGFLPRRGGQREARLAELSTERRTIVLFEAPHRLARTLADLAGACGADRPVAVARELTKLHEEVWRGALGAAAERAASVAPRGEHVLVVGGAPAPPPAGEEAIAEALRQRLDAGRDARSAVAEVARELQVPKRLVYDLALRLRRT